MCPFLKNLDVETCLAATSQILFSHFLHPVAHISQRMTANAIALPMLTSDQVLAIETFLFRKWVYNYICDELRIVLRYWQRVRFGEVVWCKVLDFVLVEHGTLSHGLLFALDMACVRVNMHRKVLACPEIPFSDRSYGDIGAYQLLSLEDLCKCSHFVMENVIIVYPTIEENIRKPTPCSGDLTKKSRAAKADRNELTANSGQLATDLGLHPATPQKSQFA
ncbi:hypothetical protein PENSPDRAFT_672500 [Peniophora sp. CONT]|nr:hypothetical protein PENSPDRAFT_672500 [Peniophora sp. CONT]